MFFKNEYKEAYERQKKLTEEAIKSAEEWKELAKRAKEKYEQVINKDLREAAEIIMKLKKQNERLLLAVAMMKNEK